MKTRIPILVSVLTIIAIFGWLEPGAGVFIALAILPYVVAHFIVRENYLESTQHCVSEYLTHTHHIIYR